MRKPQCRIPIRIAELAPIMLEVPRVASPTAERLEADYIRRGRPVIITGMAEDWPARRSVVAISEVVGEGVVVPIRGNRHHFRLLGTIPFPD